MLGIEAAKYTPQLVIIMMKFIKHIILLIGTLSAFTAIADTVRVYCHYVPKGKEAQAVASVDKLPYKKLMKTNGKDSVNAPATFQSANQIYTLSEQDFHVLWTSCAHEIENVQKLGVMVDLMASNANQYESVAWHYKLRVTPGEDLVSSLRIQALEDLDQKTLLELGLTKKDEKTLEEGLTDSKLALKEILSKMEQDSRFKQLVSSIKGAATNNYTISALTIAALLASWWFAPALYAGAVDMLFPIVYQALFGIPSPWTPQYWLVFYPAKMHAVAWTYNNATLITPIATTLIGVIGKTAHYLTARFSKKDIQNEVAAIKSGLAQ